MDHAFISGYFAGFVFAAFAPFLRDLRFDLVVLQIPQLPDNIRSDVPGRNLLRKESILTLSAIFRADVNPTLAGQPFAYPPPPKDNTDIHIYSLTEYYADCSTDGNPTLLLMNLEITTKNLNHGSPLSVSIETTPLKGIYSMASLPRMNLNGEMVKIQDKNEVSPVARYEVNVRKTKP